MKVRAAALCLLVCACAGCPEREAAIDALALAEDVRDAGSERLVTALSEGPAERRARAAVAMGRIQSPFYGRHLEPATAAGQSHEVRLAALFAVGQLGLLEGTEVPPSWVEVCRVALADVDPAIVARAVEALGKLATEEVPALVAPLSRHADARVRTQVAHALFRRRFVPLWRREAQAPPALDDGSVAVLVAALGDPAVDVRRAAAHGLSRFGEPRAVEPLLSALADGDAAVRLFAARALGRSGPAAARAAAPLRALFGDGDPQVRDEAVRASVVLDPQAPLPAGLDTDASHHVRAATAAATGDAGRLARFLEDHSVTVRAAALGSLARSHPDSAAAAVLALAGEDDWRLRAAAARASATIDRSVAERLTEDPDSRVATTALQAVAGHEGASRFIERALEADDLAVRGTAVTLLAGLEIEDTEAILLRAYRNSPGDEWVEVRESIVDVLADLPESESALRTVLESDDAPSVRRRAATALDLDPPVTPPGRPSIWLGREVAGEPEVELETTKGTIVIRCHADEAPLHVAAFVDRVSEGFYDGLIWHRVVPNFVIQGGDPRGDGWGTGGVPLRDEINTRPFTRGSVGMPKAGKDTGGCQLFVTHVPTPHLDGNYTVFGQVVEGLEVIDRIEIGDKIVRATVR